MNPTMILLLSCFIGSYADKSAIVKRQAGAPTCPTPLYTGVVSENSLPGTVVLTASATPSVGQLSWTIVDTTFGRFTINPSTGVVSVAGSLARAAMARSALEFRIRATDNVNNLYCESTVRVNVLPNPVTTTAPSAAPIFTQSSYAFTSGQVTSGSQVGQVSVRPVSGNVIYAISGTSLFSINAFTGLITANANLAAGTYTFQVSATTPFGTSNAVVTVNVQGTIQQTVSFPQTTYSYSSASCAQGSVIAQLTASSSSATPTYSISGSTLFAINPLTGQITVVGNVASGTYTFNVIASLPTGQQAVAQVTITLNCPVTGQAPTFSRTSYTVTTSACTAGTNVAIVQAGGSTTTPTTYAVSGTNLFAINPQSGQITLNQNANPGTYTFQIFATSAFGSATATITVNVQCATGLGNSIYYTAGSCPAGTQVGSICAGTPLNIGR